MAQLYALSPAGRTIKLRDWLRGYGGCCLSSGDLYEVLRRTKLHVRELDEKTLGWIADIIPSAGYTFARFAATRLQRHEFAMPFLPLQGRNTYEYFDPNVTLLEGKTGNNSYTITAVAHNNLFAITGVIDTVTSRIMIYEPCSVTTLSGNILIYDNLYKALTAISSADEVKKMPQNVQYQQIKHQKMVQGRFLYSLFRNNITHRKRFCSVNIFDTFSELVRHMDNVQNSDYRNTNVILGVINSTISFFWAPTHQKWGVLKDGEPCFWLEPEMVTDNSFAKHYAVLMIAPLEQCQRQTYMDNICDNTFENLDPDAGYKIAWQLRAQNLNIGVALA